MSLTAIDSGVSQHLVLSQKVHRVPFSSHSHHRPPYFRGSILDQARQVDCSFHVGHSLMSVLVREAIGRSHTVELERRSSIVVYWDRKGIRCVDARGMEDAHHVRTRVSVGVRQVDWLERLVECLPKQVLVERYRVVADEDGGRKRRMRSELVTTNTLDMLIAAAANMGSSRMPKNG